nr:hypothetical protein [uncultured Dyadobacter sp.]
MKLFRSTPIFINGILIVGMLSACQNETDIPVTPEASTETTDQNARTNLAAGTLLTDGDISFSYDSQNQKLKKESHTGYYYDISYTPQLITATKIKYGSPSTDCKYTLDANGRCIQTTTSANTFIYQYNADGQLASYYNKNYPEQQVIFTYTTDTDGWKKSLTKVTFHDVYGVKTIEIRYSYGAAANFIPDKHPLAPDVLPAEVSKYLPIFGCFNTNLPKIREEDVFLPGGQIASSTKHLYTYTLGISGKATNITVKKTNGTLVSSTDRKYLTPSFSM